jgi:hypothetical protein
MQEGVALALVGLAVLVVALVPALLVMVARSAVRRMREPRDGKAPLRRCDRCGRGWRARPGHEVSVIGLRVRRWVRRRARERDVAALPKWAGPAGWSRCPSCLSTRVRMSGEEVTPETWTAIEKIGMTVGVTGMVVLAVAAIGVLL